IPSSHTLPGMLVVTNRNVTFYGRQIITLPILEIATYNYSANTIEFSYPGRADESFFQVLDAEAVAVTFYAARMRAEQPPPSVRNPPASLPYVDPIRQQHEEAMASARRAQEEAAAAARRQEEKAAAEARRREEEAQQAERLRRRRDDLAARFGDE